MFFVFCFLTETDDLFERLPAPYGVPSSFQRIQITSSHDEIDRETKEVCEMIRKCIALRRKWIAVMEVVSVHVLPSSPPKPHGGCCVCFLNQPTIPDSAELPLSPRAPGARLRHREEIPYDPLARPVRHVFLVLGNTSDAGGA